MYYYFNKFPAKCVRIFIKHRITLLSMFIKLFSDSRYIIDTVMNDPDLPWNDDEYNTYIYLVSKIGTR